MESADDLLVETVRRDQKSGGAAFRLPFSLSMLADYIATDRSAMMRALKKLREEGVLVSDGRQIRLLEI